MKPHVLDGRIQPYRTPEGAVSVMPIQHLHLLWAKAEVGERYIAVAALQFVPGLEGAGEGRFPGKLPHRN